MLQKAEQFSLIIQSRMPVAGKAAVSLASDMHQIAIQSQRQRIASSAGFRSGFFFVHRIPVILTIALFIGCLLSIDSLYSQFHSLFARCLAGFSATPMLLSCSEDGAIV